VVTPRFPYPEAGADEQDRAGGIRQLQRLGYQVTVVAKCFSWQPLEEIQEVWRKQGVTVVLVVYKNSEHRAQKIFKKFCSPRLWDGAAAEFFDPEMQGAVAEQLRVCNPVAVWFDYTYLWPLYHLVRQRNIPILVRSHNFEATHFLAESGRTITNYLKSIPKFITEYRTARTVDKLFAISPDEAKKYQSIGARAVDTLPLRSLTNKIGTHTPRTTTEPLNLFFAGSTYNVSHNRRALEFVLQELAPRLEEQFPNAFKIHIFGSKFPADLEKAVVKNVIKRGFVADLDAAMLDMDIALAPSFFGEGMQQKIFEPLARGFPTITNNRGLAGYDFSEEEIRCRVLLGSETSGRFGASHLRRYRSDYSGCETARMQLRDAQCA
jgi:glycosyltransferase involved in cell wall biosynthesis